MSDVIHGVLFGIGWALSSQGLYYALRRTPVGRDATRRVAREIKADLERPQ